MSTTKRCEINRHTSGVPHILGRESVDLFWGLGYCHAMDRGMQMLLMRVLGEGRACEHLDSSDEMLKIDLFFRRMNWNGRNAEEPGKLAVLRPFIPNDPRSRGGRCSYQFGGRAIRPALLEVVQLRYRELAQPDV